MSFNSRAGFETQKIVLGIDCYSYRRIAKAFMNVEGKISHSNKCNTTSTTFQLIRQVYLCFFDIIYADLYVFLQKVCWHTTTKIR